MSNLYTIYIYIIQFYVNPNRECKFVFVFIVVVHIFVFLANLLKNGREKDARNDECFTSATVNVEV